MQRGSTKRYKARPTGQAVCECCGLLAPRAELVPWLQRVQCRRLAIQDPARPDRRPEQEWIKGVYRYYYVTNEYQVCYACFDHLLDGGEFAPVLRHRGKIGFLVLAAVVVGLMFLLPEILPILRSALWLDRAEN
ncbi:MAG TPA: hypothetical protein VHX64_11050 [Caulobacteraceae bacterium]|nr:hypothetical protein [Caulobacteraceae bacterium]